VYLFENFEKKTLTRTYQRGCMCEHDNKQCSSQLLFGKQLSWVLWFANAIVGINYYLNQVLNYACWSTKWILMVSKCLNMINGLKIYVDTKVYLCTN